MAVVTIPKLIMQNWQSEGEKQLINRCVWESLSNRTEERAVLPNGDSNDVPDSCVHYVSDQFKKGVMFTNIPSFDKLKQRGGMGWEKEQGNEEAPSLRYARVYYNVERKSVALEGDSLDDDAAAGYAVVKQGFQLIQDYFAELGDYNKQRAVLEYATEAITESYAWQGAKSFTGAPVATRLHPNIYMPTLSAALPWVAPASPITGSHAAAYTALATKLITLPATQKFTLTELQSCLRVAQRHCKRMAWKSGNGQNIYWIIKMSHECADMLMNSDTKFGDKFANADERSVKNRDISGILGVYRNALLLTDDRAPVFNVLTEKFSYQKAWEEVGNGGLLVEEVERSPYTTQGQKESGSVGSGIGATFEVIQILGKGAVACTRVRELKYNNDSVDYDFSKGLEARRACGDMRPDFYTEPEAAPKNWSSALYFVPTPVSTF